MKPSDRYRRDAVLLHDFREAFIDLVNSARSEPDGFSYQLVSATDNATWQRKRRAVATAAGAAVHAHLRHGGTFTLRNAAYMMHDVSPVVNWEMALRDPEQLSPEMVIASVDAAEGAAIRLAEEAKTRERGLIGLIAAFLRWPSSLREAVGSDHGPQATAASAIGILGQILVATIATALGTAIVTGVAKLWSAFV